MLPPATAALVAAATAPAPVLIRLTGTVGFALSSTDVLQKLEDRLDLGAGGYALTLASSQAQLSFDDGTRVAIGERTMLGYAASDGKTATIELARGAVHVIVRPTSVIAILTPTAGIALSDADAFIVTGPRGTQIACVRCAPTTVLRTPAGHAQLGNCTLGDAGANALRVRSSIASENPAMDALVGGADATAGCPRSSRTHVDPTGSDPGARDPLANGWGTFTAGALFAILTMIGPHAG
ncbi:MAG TPA: FecR family protein [Candidatus Sulfotelmatobacter sp.]|nr:FecR family protein [Candidatus Sulfotelmatobacter sp.]